MMNDLYLFDTYALLEIINGNKNYLKYTDSIMIINNFIFAELCYKLLREGVRNAEKHIDDCTEAIVNVAPEVIKEAMEFRVVHKKRKLSMTDCISYIMAKNMGIKFLTGDKEFENFESVEFVK